MLKVVLLGAGRLATSLAPALVGCGVQITQVFSRTLDSAARLALALKQQTGYEPVAVDDIADIADDADCYFYAISDDAIASVAKAMAAKPQVRNALHLHTSGSVPLQVISDLFPQAAVFYPFQTFSMEQIVDLSDVPFFIEATTDDALQSAKSLAQRLSTKVFEAGSEQRRRLHLAGVFANNFSNAMFAIAEQQMQKAGLPFSVLMPLIQQTAGKVETMTPCQAQTGPAARGDVNTIKEHLEMLSGQEKEIYKLITQYIMHN